MAMEQTGTGSFEITAKLNITTSQTAAVWRERGKDGGYFVKLNTTLANIAAAADSVITVDLLADGDHDNVVGLLRSADGTDDALLGRILMLASDVRVTGGGTGALAAADMTDGIQGDADGKAEIAAAAADSFGTIIGGDKANLRMAFISRLLIANTA